jgi:hypothetical protein
MKGTVVLIDGRLMVKCKNSLEGDDVVFEYFPLKLSSSLAPNSVVEFDLEPQLHVDEDGSEEVINWAKVWN